MQAKRENKAYEHLPWVQDLGTINSENVTLVEVAKLCEVKANNIKFYGEPVVTSVKSKCEGKMVLIFSQPFDAQKIPALNCMVRDSLVNNFMSCSYENLQTNFEFANLYFDCGESHTKIKSFKASLEEFCSRINKFVHRSVTSTVILKGYDAPDISETMNMSEETEKISLHTNPMEHTSKDTNNLVYQKHPTDHGNLNSTRVRDTYDSFNDVKNHTMPSVEVKAKTLNSGSQSDNVKDSESQKNEQKSVKTLRNQDFLNDVHGMRQSHKEEHLTAKFGSQGNHCTLGSSVRDSHGDVVQSCHRSNMRSGHPLLDQKEEPLNTVCDSQYSACIKNNDTLTLKNQSTLTSYKCSVKEQYAHIPTEPKSRYIQFCNMRAIFEEDCSGLKRKYFGFKSTSEDEKVIILIGNKGSGKTTLINSVANFLKGIEAVDDELFCVIMDQIYEHSHTLSMTAYTFCFAEGDIPITIIDTPGLTDIRETEKNNPLQILKTFFTSNNANIHIHAIGYVISSSAVGLTSSERHMIDFLIEHYGRGISTNFITFTTFADIQKVNKVSDIFQSYGIKSKILKFNNTVFSIEEVDDFDQCYWKLGIKSWKKCIKVLKVLPPLAIKILKVKQKQIYSSYLVNSAEDKLKNELKKFILSFKEKKSLTQPIQENSEQVWQLAMALYHLASLSDCSFSDIECVLVKYVDEMAKETAFPPKDCVMLLSLCPSRGLLEAGKKIIEFMGTIYAQTITGGLQNIPVRKEPDVLYCKTCYRRHKIKRVEGKFNNITYNCMDCSCDGADHVKKPLPQGKPKMECHLSKRYCLDQTKNAIESILQEFSVPGHVMNIGTYLVFVGQHIDDQFKDFIESIMSSRSLPLGCHASHM